MRYEKGRKDVPESDPIHKVTIIPRGRVFEGIPTFPDAGRFWQICDKLGVTHFYTAPTAIRSLMLAGETPILAHSLASLKVLGSVGEPIN